MLKPARSARGLLLLSAVFLMYLRPAFAQEFTMTASPASPSSVDPGVSSLATITLGSLNGFNGTVALSCSVSPPQANAATCAIQASATPPATAALTIQTTT